MKTTPTAAAAPRPDETTRSPLRTVQVLYELASSRAAVSLADLSARLNLPKTSLFRLMKTLESGNYVIAVPGGYAVGAETLKLGATIVQNREFPNCALPVMQSISDDCGETIILGTMADNRTEVVYSEVLQATNPLRFISTAGSTNPLYGSASGQILLAHMPENELKAYLGSVKFTKHAPGTIQTVKALQDKLAEIRRTGVSESLEGLVEGVYSVAAAIVDMNNKVVAGLSISAPSSRALRQKSQLRKLAMQGAAEISSILGYTGRYPLVED